MRTLLALILGLFVFASLCWPADEYEPVKRLSGTEAMRFANLFTQVGADADLPGGVFVIETASVILQVASFKLTGKRIFRMAPIHHHFELKGWAEPKVIVRFWIISLLLVLLGLATLKVR